MYLLQPWFGLFKKKKKSFIAYFAFTLNNTIIRIIPIQTFWVSLLTGIIASRDSRMSDKPKSLVFASNGGYDPTHHESDVCWKETVV